jgi:hypothetical protein
MGDIIQSGGVMVKMGEPYIYYYEIHYNRITKFIS